LSPSARREASEIMVSKSERTTGAILRGIRDREILING
jgi:hypothetical protein